MSPGSKPGDGDLFEDYLRLCELVSKVDKRCQLLGASEELDEAWRAGSRLPLLRVKRTQLRRALDTARAS